MIYIGKIQVCPLNGGRTGPGYEIKYRIITYHNDKELLKEILISHRRNSTPKDIFGKEKEWGKIRIECWSPGQLVGSPYTVREFLEII